VGFSSAENVTYAPTDDPALMAVLVEFSAECEHVLGDGFFWDGDLGHASSLRDLYVRASVGL